MRRLAFACALLVLGGSAAAQEPAAGTAHASTHRHGAAPSGVPPVFQAVGSVPFASLMADAMSVMDDGMRRAPMTGEAGHDFVTMMLPHHQGAIDMARAVLLHTQDPALRNLALGIIAEQQNEINLMRAWLVQHRQQGKKP